MRKITFFLSTIFLSAGMLTSQVYVDVNATGANDGSSWENAYTDLQAALSLADPVEIWVADGTYLPSLQDTSLFYRLSAAHAVYGGFEGNETERAQRDWLNNVTRLEGDIAGDDTNDPSENKEDNAAHLIVIPDGLNDVVIDGLEIQGGFSVNLGGAGILSFARAHIRNCRFVDNVGSSGAAVRCIQGHGSTIEDCVFQENTASSQGAVLLDEVLEGKVRRCSFFDNVVNRGCVYSLFCIDVDIDSCSFVGNTGTGFSAGVFNWNSTGLRVRSCSFSDNSAENATVIYNDGRELFFLESLQVIDCEIFQNEATDFGGQIYAWRSNYEVSGTSFIGNNAAGTGGAIYNGNSLFSVRDCAFENNVANFGAATANYNGETAGEYFNCSFRNNLSNTSGAASIVGFTASVNFRACEFRENNAQWGGAIYMQNDSSAVMVDSCEFAGNTAANFGGAINAFASNSLGVNNSLFEGNMANFGGAIGHGDDSMGFAMLTIDKSNFNFNIATTQGGAINLENNQVEIKSSVFTNNGAGSGAGGAIINNAFDRDSQARSADLDLVNCTFSDNLSSLGTAVAQFQDGQSTASTTMLNTIWHNPSSDVYAVEAGEAMLISRGGNLVSQENLGDFMDGENDAIGENPRFSDPLGFDYSLRDDSPAIDQGLSDGAHVTDILGNSITGQVDKGAYESDVLISTLDLRPQSTLRIIENPVQDVLRFTLGQDYVGRLTAKLFDTSGKLVAQLNVYVSQSDTQVIMPVNGVMSGTYVLQVDGEAYAQAAKVELYK